MSNHSTQRGAILVEFIVVIPVLLFVLYAGLSLNEKMETKHYFQQSVGNLKGHAADAKNNLLDKDMLVYSGIELNSSSDLMSNYKEVFDQDPETPPYRLTAVEGGEDIKENKAKFKSKDPEVYEMIISFQETIANYLYKGVMAKLGSKGLFFDSEAGIKYERFEFIDTVSKLKSKGDFTGLSSILGEGVVSPITSNFVEQIVFQEETGYHPDSSHDLMTLPGLGFSFTKHAKHWGVFSSTFNKNTSRYRKENKGALFIANAVTKISLFTDMAMRNSKVFDSMLTNMTFSERKETKKVFRSLRTKTEKKSYIDKLNKEGKLKTSDDGNSIGAAGNSLLEIVKLRKGFTLNCPFRYTVGSNCITPSMYGALLPIIASLSGIINTVGDFFSGGGYAAGRMAFKEGVKQAIKGAVDVITEKVTESIKEQIQAQIGNVENIISKEIQTVIDERKADVLKILLKDDFFDFTK